MKTGRILRQREDTYCGVNDVRLLDGTGDITTLNLASDVHSNIDGIERNRGYATQRH